MIFPRMTLGRLLRLCLKEWRESLRDRRTIITLVLMPLMVYPLLSLVLNRIIPTDAPIYIESSVRIGIGNSLRESGMETIVLMGYALLQDPKTAPVFIEVPREDRSSGTKLIANSTAALPVPQFVHIADSERQALRRNSADVVIIGKINPSEDEPHPSVSPELNELLTQISKIKELPPQFSLDLKQLAQSLGRYEIAYRYGDPQSERAFALVERSLLALNAMVAAKKSASEPAAPYTISGSPIAMRHGQAELLATLIPLVLVLMTMAGAVYPAIDLTAGERERGTMEALVVSPTSAVWILFSKYTAVVSVAMLTALANLGAMTLTLWISGVGKLIFGESSLTTATVGQVLILLILFTMFFAALLLAVTSFAKSFKEAQAYLIPLMLLALTPGVTSLMPGIEFSPILATLPLVNIVLLAREVLQGDASWNTGAVTLVCNCVYAMAALTVAARLFGASAAVQGSQGSWRDWLTRPSKYKDFATADQMALLLAVMFPIHFVVTSLIFNRIAFTPIPIFLITEAIALWMTLGVIPLGIAWYQKIRWKSSFLLTTGVWTRWEVGIIAIVLLAIGGWAIQHELTAISIKAGLGFRSQDQVLTMALLNANLFSTPVWIAFFHNVITPALTLELLFRGFTLTSLKRVSAITAICTSAVLFGLFEMLASHTLSLDRFFPMVGVGLLLGWLATRSQSIWPSVLVRILMLGVPQVLDYFKSSLPAWQAVSNARNQLPLSWTMIGTACLVLGVILVSYACRAKTVNR
jgi:ABC-2 type transport system permease protein/sodium transport system permease protein